jgi:hypothetical protein
LRIVTNVERGMRWTQAVPQDERRCPRTAKSYCPDAPRQASSSRKNFRGRRSQKSPVSGETTKETVTPSRGECRNVSAYLW